MKHSNQQKEPIKQWRTERLGPSYKKQYGILTVIRKELVDLMMNFGKGFVPFVYEAEHSGHLMVTEAHHKDGAIHLILKTQKKSKIIVITISDEDLEGYSYFLAQPIKLKNQQQDLKPSGSNYKDPSNVLEEGIAQQMLI